MLQQGKDLPEGREQVLETGQKDLMLHNDDHNTFDFVIESLIDVCGHDYLQAEQCTWIAHYKGKCPVKSGGFEELRPLHEEFSRRGLTTTIG